MFTFDDLIGYFSHLAIKGDELIIKNDDGFTITMNGITASGETLDETSYAWLRKYLSSTEDDYSDTDLDLLI